MAPANKSSWRSKLINFVSPSSPFDNFIVAAILLNSITLACVDYEHVDNNYQPSTDSSPRNSFIEKAEYVFTFVFACECMLKCAAYGFWRGKQAYFHDGWNVLDLCILIVSILALLPNVPNFVMLRSFRVFRPLRSISKLPNLRRIVIGFIKSLPELSNVLLLLLFILVGFAIFGVTFWRGLFHWRCRLTPYPIKMPLDCRNASEPCWDEFILDAVSHPDAYKCLPLENDDTRWSTEPQDCIWPIDENDARVCGVLGEGYHGCVEQVEFMAMNVSRICGSNYVNDIPRFIASQEPYGFPRMQSDVFYSYFNWGFTNFDDFGAAFLTSFQIVTMEGWSDIMYRTLDSWSSTPTVISYISLILIGSQLVLNIMLAVISNSLDDKEDTTTLVEEYGSNNDGETKTKPSKKRQTAMIKRIQWLVETKSYDNAMLIVILINTIILSCDHYGISATFLSVLDAGNFFTTGVFCLDMVLCNLALGLRDYWSSPTTFFDGTIAIASVAELIVTRAAANGNSGKSVMSVFRSLRLVRLFKMIQSWKSLHSLLNTISKAAADVRSFGVLFFLFIFIYGLLGMQLFANRLHFDPVTGVHIDIQDPRYSTSDIPRHNFDTLPLALITVFQILSGENWNEVMYDCWKATAWLSPLYFLSLVVIGVFIVLNLFLAILLKQFDDSETPTESEEQLLPEIGNESRSKSLTAIHLRIQEWSRFITNDISCESCRYSYAKLRSRCRTLVRDRRFEAAVTATIVLSSITLALDNPLSDPLTPLASVLETSNHLFTILFIYEFMVKIFAYGVSYFSDPWNLLDVSAVAASILEAMNFGPGKSFRAMRTLRVLRPLKMINRFPEIKLVVDALLSSLPAVVNVGLICGVLFLTFAIFGVTFLKGAFYQCSETLLTLNQMDLITYPSQYGDFDSNQLAWLDATAAGCNLGEWSTDYTPTSKDLCLCLGSEWQPTIPQNFDNALRGFALLFEISTTEGWVNVMYAAIDQRGIDMQPVKGSNQIWAAYFIVFLILGAFFLLELFVGVIVQNFARIREIKGCGLMTPSQRQWAQTQSFVMKIKPERRFSRPAAKIRAACYDFVMPSVNPLFDHFILGIILFNTACIASASFGDSAEKEGYLALFNGICSAIFIVETSLKLTALGKTYFRSKWNRFDFIIVFGLVIGIILKQTIANERLAASISSMIGILRIGRIFRLIRLIKSLRTIVNSTVTGIPGILNIGGLLLLLFFIYAVIGMQLYGAIGFQGELNEHANFRSFGNSMLLLFRFSTGENWNGFMWDLLQERPVCDPNPTYPAVNGCSAGPSVFVYFYSFVLIVGLVILNMFVGVVLEAFENSQESDILGPTDLDHFISVWQEFDPDATNYIKASDVNKFLRRLQPPLGIATDEDDRDDKTASFNQNGFYFEDQSLLEIAVNEKKEVNIINVARQVAKRLVKAKQGDSFRDLNENHPIHRQVMKQQKEMKMTLGDVYINDARVILNAVRRFKRARSRTNSATVYPES